MMDVDTAKKLRAPFPADKVGKLPRVSCGKCRDAPQKVCGEHAKSRCRDCHNWITSAHMHLDYVGHADVTDRLLDADPGWAWEPVASTSDGLPLLDGNGGLWIRLSVAGVTRIGYGHADGKRGGDAVKEAIGDALRNAAMRFGVALDLWRKDDPVGEPRQQQLRQPTDEPVWDAAEQEALFDGWSADIAKARTVEDLHAIGGTLKTMRRRGELSPVAYDRLVQLGAARRAELNGMPIGEKTRARLFALFGELGLGGDENRQARRDMGTQVLGRTVESMRTLTEVEGRQMVTALEQHRKGGAKP